MLRDDERRPGPPVLRRLTPRVYRLERHRRQCRSPTLPDFVASCDSDDCADARRGEELDGCLRRRRAPPEPGSRRRGAATSARGWPLAGNCREASTHRPDTLGLAVRRTALPALRTRRGTWPQACTDRPGWSPAGLASGLRGSDSAVPRLTQTRQSRLTALAPAWSRASSNRTQSRTRPPACQNAVTSLPTGGRTRRMRAESCPSRSALFSPSASTS